MPITRPAPHGQILEALSRNRKLPDVDVANVRLAQERYRDWRRTISDMEGEGDVLLNRLLEATNVYKKFIELDLIFLSEADFLYRQAGQLKLNNTILEEFMPFLVDERMIPGIREIANITVGPQACYAGMYVGPVHAPLKDGGIFIKTKNQDFTVGRKLFLRACPSGRFEDPVSTDLNVAYFVSEIKTNLDKTMFQEAAATARELKSSVGDAVYVLLCEWLDMPPIDTRVTDIDEVIILRRARRLGSQVRAQFSSLEGRRAARDQFERHLTDNPLSVPSFQRLIEKLNSSFPEDRGIDEGNVLHRGYF